MGAAATLISRIWHIARREWLEQRRQPAMLAAIATLYAIVAGLVVTGIAALDYLASSQEGPTLVAALVGSDDVEGAPTQLAGFAVTVFTYLLFTQFLGSASALAGHAVLHDRQCGTMSFLLLAPVRRYELLLGKVLGAIGWTWLLYVITSIVGGIATASFPIARVHAAWLPLSLGWWAAFLVAAPAWSMFIGSICTVISARAIDVRTAQQGVWFVVFFATLVSGGLLTWSLQAGIAAQFASATLAAWGAAMALAIGAVATRADLP